MLVDSHCHLNLIDLSEFDNQVNTVIQRAKSEGVHAFLSVCVELDDYPKLCTLADEHEDVYISVGIHPNNPVPDNFSAEQLIHLANSHAACIAIGETGLDYYRVETPDAQKQQRQVFREHIKAAIASSKPLIIHTRQAAEDTLRVMKEENAAQIGGVMHCFAEDWDIAKQAMAMNFYISLSGIVTFKNATTLQDLAKKIPADKLLVETDSPYLAPVPFRGKQNHPALVKHVALALAELRGVSFEELAQQTTHNFKTLFRC